MKPPGLSKKKQADIIVHTKVILRDIAGVLHLIKKDIGLHRYLKLHVHARKNELVKLKTWQINLNKKNLQNEITLRMNDPLRRLQFLFDHVFVHSHAVFSAQLCTVGQNKDHL